MSPLHTLIPGAGGVAALLVGVLLLTASTLALLARLRPRDWLTTLLGGYVVAYGSIVLVIEVLSELHAIRRGPLLIAHAMLAAVTLVWARRQLGTLVQRLPRPGRVAATGYAWLRRHPRLGILALGVALSFIIHALLILYVPPNTWDSYLYHLSRVGHWLHNDTLRHFPSPLQLRNAYPPNGEIGLLWLILLWGNDRLTGFLQWAAALVLMLAIYAIARRLRFSRAAALFAALVWQTFTVVVAQTTSTKNDLLLATFTTLASYFLLVTLQEGDRRAPLFFGLALGLAAGTKPLSALVLPGLAALALGIWLSTADASRRRVQFNRLLQAAGWAVVGFLALGAYNYVLNWQHYGALTGPPVLKLAHFIEQPTLRLFVSNLARMAYNFCDPGGLPLGVAYLLRPLRSTLGERVFAWLHISPNPPETFALNEPFRFRSILQYVPREDASWYGPLGYLFLLPAVGYHLLVAPLRRWDRWRWLMALSSLLYALAFAWQIYWLPWEGRLLMPAVALAAPLLAQVYVWLWGSRATWLRWVGGLLPLLLLYSSIAQNFHKPLLGPQAIWGQDVYALRTIQAPEMGPIYRTLDEAVPSDARLGVLGPWPTMSWDYPYYGPTLEREVIDLGEEYLPITEALFAHHDLDYLLVTVPVGADDALPPELNTQLATRYLGQGRGLHWYLVERPQPM